MQFGIMLVLLLDDVVIIKKVYHLNICTTISNENKTQKSSTHHQHIS